MKKRVFVILMSVMLGSAGTLSPAYYVLAQESTEEKDDKGILEQGAEIGEDLYQKLDEAVSGVDKQSLRRQIRQALREMDEMGISPTVVAKNLFGIGVASGSGSSKQGGAKPGNTLIEDAQKRVKKTTEGFFSVLWNGFLDTLEGVIGTGLSIFGKGSR